MQKIKVSFDVWIQLVGMLGVLGGLVFVGLEMRQAQTIAIAGQVQARAQMQTDRILAPLQGNLGVLRYWNSARYSYQDLSEDEKLVARAAHQWKGIMLENNYFQYKMGLFDESYWAQSEQRIAEWKNDCDFRNVSGNQVRIFQEYLDSIPDECAE